MALLDSAVLEEFVVVERAGGVVEVMVAVVAAVAASSEADRRMTLLGRGRVSLIRD